MLRSRRWAYPNSARSWALLSSALLAALTGRERRRTPASGAAEGPILAEALRRRGGEALEAGARREGRRHRVEQRPERAEVALGRGREGLLHEMVARDVDRVDPVHGVRVRSQRA